MLNKQLMREWIFTLRSGYYRNIQHYLSDGKGGHCVQGVLCELIGWIPIYIREYDLWSYKEWEGASDQYFELASSLGLKLGQWGDFNKTRLFWATLVDSNNKGVSHAELADRLEQRFLPEDWQKTLDNRNKINIQLKEELMENSATMTEISSTIIRKEVINGTTERSCNNSNRASHCNS